MSGEVTKGRFRWRRRRLTGEDVSRSGRSSAAHRVAEVERPGALDHDRVLERDVAADEVAEVTDAGTEQHWHLADADLVDETEAQRLLDGCRRWRS
jgi:hypothetical protein